MTVDTKALKTIEDKLIFAERLADLFTNSFTKKEFVAAFEQVIKIFLSLKEQHKSEVSKFREEYEKAKETYSHEKVIGTLSKKLDSYLAETTALVEERLDTVRDGKDADEDAVLKRLVETIKIPTIEELSNDLPKLGSRIRDALELLQGNERLDKSAIKGLDELIKSFHNRINDIPRGRLGMKRVPIIKRYNLTSQVDGSTKTFTLPADTVDVVGVFGTQFPINFNPGTDWTFAGRTLTLTSEVSAPASGQTLYAIIETLFYG